MNQIIRQSDIAVWLRLPPHNKVCIIDRADLELFQQHRWGAYCGRPHLPRDRQHWPVRRSQRIDGKRTDFYLARTFLDAPNDLMVDHINSNSLDNRRANLRLATCSQNSINSRKHIDSPYLKGVHARKHKGKITGYKAKACLNGVYTYLGVHKTVEAARKIYLEFVEKHHGEFARVE